MKTRFWAGAGLLFWAAGAHGAAECVDGDAGGYACSHIDLVAHLTVAQLGGAPGERLNDIWGWTDPDSGEEYAIIGMSNGTAFVRLPDNGAPEFLGRLPGSDGVSPVAKTSAAAEKMCLHDDACDGGEASRWRDVKVFNGHAFIVSEAPSFGMQVFDLTQLRTATAGQEWLTNHATHYAGVGHAHNVFINEESARAYIVGAGPVGSPNDGGLHVVDVSDPKNPVREGDIDGDGYTHDVQCVMYRGPDPDFTEQDELCFASNEDTVTIWHLGNFPHEAPEILARFTYPGVGYVHQGWLSDDQRYFFFNDEMDEIDSGSRTRLRVLDVSDVRNPELAAEYLAPSRAIDHNNYVHGRWLLQSNYAAGLRILDILEPEHPVEAAYFDTRDDDVTDFVGVWSNYYFSGASGSGRVVLSDIFGGLYVVKPRLSVTGTAPDLTVTAALERDTADVNTGVEAVITLRNGNATGASEVLLTVHLPRGAAFDAAPAPTGWNCDTAGRVAQCRRASLPANAEDTFRFEFASATAGTVDLIAMAYALEADAAPVDNLASESLVVNGPGARNPQSGGGAVFWLLGLAFVPVLGKVRQRRTA